jgi:hypothetical protein
MQNSSAFQFLALDTIHESTANPRRTFEESKLHELAESIRQHGLIQPITVRPNSEGFEIVAGARRFRAAQLAELFAILIRCERSTSENIRTIAFAELVKRQDRGTILRALAKLRENPDDLREADVGPPRDGSAAWIGGISSEWAWDDLAKLRRLTLRSGLVYLCDTVTNKLRKLNVARLANTVRAQLLDAPESWRPRQSAFALECERDGQILAAQSLPFDRVLALLRTSTSLIALKIYVEGSTDVPIYARLLTEMGEPDLAEKIDVVGGWPSLLNRPVDRWLDGCREAVIIMDGDNGREYGKTTPRYSPDARKAFLAFKRIRQSNRIC